MGGHVPKIGGFIRRVLVRELAQPGDILFFYATAFLRISEPRRECALDGMDRPAASRQCGCLAGRHVACDRQAPSRLGRERATSVSGSEQMAEALGTGDSHQHCWVFFALELHGVGWMGRRTASA